MCSVGLFDVIKEHTIVIRHLLRLLSVARWRGATLFSKVDPNILRFNVKNKMTLMPNLMQILSIFLKLQAIKQSGPGFFQPTL